MVSKIIWKNKTMVPIGGNYEVIPCQTFHIWFKHGDRTANKRKTANGPRESDGI